MVPRRSLRLVALLMLVAVPALAQAPVLPALQDSTLDNLVHAKDYVTAAPGTLGAVVERGKGPIDMVLVSGFGNGASVFDGFMQRNASRYHMVAVTLPGFEGTAAPPMPPAGTSYGDQSWTRASAEAIAALIRTRKLNHPVLVGHFINGTQVAMRVALDHPDLVGGVVLLAGTPRFEPVRASRFWPKNMTLTQKVQAVDAYTAPRWFKTVTRQTWVRGNFVAADYSVDTTTLGKRVAERANDAPLPVLIRWLCEFHASDLWPDLENVRPPMLLLQPRFTTALRADTTKSYLESYFIEPWNGRLDKLPRAEMTLVDSAGILVMDDQPAMVDAKVAAFVKKRGK